ncbi:MAG: hypothetical protein ACXW31_08910 [Thermoanaerobaculia bacterium]
MEEVDPLGELRGRRVAEEVDQRGDDQVRGKPPGIARLDGTDDEREHDADEERDRHDRTGRLQRNPGRREKRQQDHRQRADGDPLEGLFRVAPEVQLGHARDEQRRCPEDREEHRHEDDLEEKRRDVRDAPGRHEVAEEQPRQRLGEQKRVIRPQFRTEHPPEPPTRPRELHELRNAERQRDRDAEDPADFARRQVEERREEIRNRRERVWPPAEPPLQRDGQWRHQEKKESRAEVIAELRVTLDRDEADSDRVRRRQVAEHEGDGKEDAGREAERRDPDEGGPDVVRYCVAVVELHSPASLAAARRRQSIRGSAAGFVRRGMSVASRDSR